MVKGGGERRKEGMSTADHLNGGGEHEDEGERDHDACPPCQCQEAELPVTHLVRGREGHTAHEGAI